jgi:hypothetical protein
MLGIAKVNVIIQHVREPSVIAGAARLSAGHSSPLPAHGGTLPAVPGVVNVDRPAGGVPMYSWGGTLITPGAAYNRTMGREREHLNCLRSSPYLFCIFSKCSV